MIKKNTVKSDAGNLARNFWRGDFGLEKPRTSARKGNEGRAGNMSKSIENKEARTSRASR